MIFLIKLYYGSNGITGSSTSSKMTVCVCLRMWAKGSAALRCILRKASLLWSPGDLGFRCGEWQVVLCQKYV